MEGRLLNFVIQAKPQQLFTRRRTPTFYIGRHLYVRQPSRTYHVTTFALAGHNKWSKIKHAKTALDLQKSKFASKMSRAIIAAVKAGGGNPDTNYSLASIISRAKSMGISKSTIESSIQSGMRKTDDSVALSVLYEGRAATGYSMLIQALTDNKNRTRQEVRSLLARNGGTMGDTGSSMFLFSHKGVVNVPRTSWQDDTDPLDVAIETGFEDVMCGISDGGEECYQFVCEVQSLMSASDLLQQKCQSIQVASSTLEYIPNSVVTLDDEAYQKAEALVAKLNDHADVVRVYDNFVLKES